MKAIPQAICLTIAGSDSAGEAGIQADLQTFNHFETIGLSAITAATAQNPKQVLSLNPLSEQALSDQLQACSQHFQIDCVKTGLIASPQQVKIISNFIKKHKLKLVIDPLIATSSGKKILNDVALSYFQKELLPQATFICPNIPEASTLSTVNITDESTLLTAGRQLKKQYQSNIIIKGGHSLESPGTDYLFTSEQDYKISTKAVEIKSSHGTGCRISSAIAAKIAQGANPLDSFLSAKEYVLNCLLSPIVSKNEQWLMPARPQWQKQTFNIEEI